MDWSSLINPAGIAALITALATGVGGTWLAFRQFSANKAKTSSEIEVNLRNELRSDIEKYRKDTEDLRDKVSQLFEENMKLRHTNGNLQMQIEALQGIIKKMGGDTSSVPSGNGKRNRKKKPIKAEGHKNND